MGSFQATILSGRSDSWDNDGDGAVDEADEQGFIVLDSRGFLGAQTAGNPYQVHLRGQVQKVTNIFNVNSALCIDGTGPDLDLGKSAAFMVSGYDHDLATGAPKAVQPPGSPLPAITVTDPIGFNASDLAALSAASAGGQVNGTTPPYGTTSTDNIDTAAMVAWAKENATFTAPATLPGSLSDYSQIVYHEGYTKITGNDKGAGIWVVNGDLDFGGTCQFHGIIIVTGKLTILGGGGSNLLMGAVIVGGGAAIDFQNNGTTDIRYSADAVNMAKNASARYSMVGWQALGN
jgi:hypothetical protein